MPDMDQEAQEPQAGPQAESAAAAPAQPAPKATPPAEEAPGEAATAPAATESGQEAQVAVLEAEVASLKDQLLRALAETENLRRRAQREREDAVKYAAASLVKDLLGVPDNLRRAIESVAEDAVANNEVLQNLIKGVELTEKELASAFEKHNIVRLDPMGERFDAHRHQAVMEIPDPAQPNGTVVQVLQSGYLYHDRLLRAAMVGVSKGDKPAQAVPPPKADKTPGSNTDAPEAPKIDTTV